MVLENRMRVENDLFESLVSVPVALLDDIGIFAARR
jgi:hypothetical protein